jgi:hypothetical protein
LYDLLAFSDLSAFSDASSAISIMPQLNIPRTIPAICFFMRCYLRNSFSDHRKPTIHQLPNHPTSGPQFFPPTTHASKKPIAPLNPAASSSTILSHRHHKTSADSTSPAGTLLVRRRPRPPGNRAEIRRWCVSTWRHLDAGRYLTLITASSWSAVDEALKITSLGTGEINFHD